MWIRVWDDEKCGDDGIYKGDVLLGEERWDEAWSEGSSFSL